MNYKKMIGSLLFAILFLSIQCLAGDKKLDRLIEKGKLEKAEEYCLKLKEKKQREGWKDVADAYFSLGDFEKAAQMYDNAGEEARNDGYKRIAEAYATKNDLGTALEFYKKIPHSGGLAMIYGRMGDVYKEKGEEEQAKNFYQKAVDEYELILKSFIYDWQPSYYNDRRRFINAFNSFEKPIDELLVLKKRSEILKRAADYCSKLKKSSIYFFCHEEISESINYGMDVGENSRFEIGTSDISPFGRGRIKGEGTKTDTYLYEYQMVQEGDKLEEIRKLKRKNNLAARKNKQATRRRKPGAQKTKPVLQTKSFSFKQIIFGPLGLLSGYWQERNDYKILREDELNGEKVVVFECLPKSHRESNPHFGTVWIKPDDGSVVKIELNPKTLGITNFVRAIAQKTKSRPVFQFFTEYANEKNGIRFPSRSVLEEAYIDEKGKKKVMVKLVVNYKDYRYFSVGAEVTDVE